MNSYDVLSLAANITAILSFTIAIGLSVTAFYVLTSNAINEIETLQSEWNNAGKEIYFVIKYWESERSRGSPELETYLRGLRASMDCLAETALSIFRDLRDLKPRIRNPSFLDLDLRRRILWAYKRKGILEKTAEFSRRRDGLIQMQLGLLLTKSISQELDVQRSIDLLKSITSDSQAMLLQKTSRKSLAVSSVDKLKIEM